ncbi:DUF1810 domain-containing protein [Salinarimonas ramus]|uniref:Calpastatin n=1 Tax=Salinarimonas ramus TaxID=690164 RepID=A0A917V301_9HYPH|nr:DUF1810 domain-containing protein [Salinarimonas ramus]GGK27542.1 hypothetical protein GCM10011322_12610 [Salinarimonas ramus]
MSETTRDDPHDLARFVSAQAGDLEIVLAELAAGAKRTHWIWWVFPQHEALGKSRNATFYGIGDLAEARAYLAHPVLGSRLRACVGLLLSHAGRDATAILGSPDDRKVRSCLTLFREAAQDPADRALFQRGLEIFYGGAADEATLALLAAR